MEIIEKVIVMDTETANTLDDPIVYDIGWAVVDYMGNVYETCSYIVADIFYDREFMNTAYYKDKIPQYERDILNNKRTIKSYAQVRAKFSEIVKKWGIKKVFAHNMPFDYRSVNTTLRWITSSKQRYFFPYGMEICDTLLMARQALKGDEDYKHFCEENAFLTKAGKPQFTAEVLYRYIINNPQYEEEHTALEDVLIEKEILTYCLKIKPDVEIHLWKEERQKKEDETEKKEEPVKPKRKRKPRTKKEETVIDNHPTAKIW